MPNAKADESEIKAAITRNKLSPPRPGAYFRLGINAVAQQRFKRGASDAPIAIGRKQRDKSTARRIKK
jgi:hypothetical protein